MFGEHRVVDAAGRKSFEVNPTLFEQFDGLWV